MSDRLFLDTELEQFQLFSQLWEYDHPHAAEPRFATLKTGFSLALSDGVKVAPVIVSSANQTLDNTMLGATVLVTTGANDRTITMPTAAAANAGGKFTIVKVDTGAGKVLFSGLTGGLWYVRNFYTVVSTGSAWQIVDATNFVPCYGELLVSYNPDSTPTTYTCQGARTIVPAGTRAVAASISVSSASVGDTVAIRATGGTNAFGMATSLVAAEYSRSFGTVPLDSNLDFDVFSESADITDVAILMAGYFP